MKKILIVGIITIGLLFVGCKKKEKTSNVEVRSLMEIEEYKSVTLDNIKTINYVTFTEGGRTDRLMSDKEEITKTYNYLKSIKIGEETERTCEDNTKVYEITLNDGTITKIEKECDWIIINNKRYLIK